MAESIKIPMKIISWNVNGMRAIVKKNFFDDFKRIDAGILCIQETKASGKQVEEAVAPLSGYYLFSNAAERPGYSGTAILSREKPMGASYGIGSDEHDREGRVILLEFERFQLVNVYVPNSGNDLRRLAYRQEWDQAFFAYLKKMESAKPLIICGDFNVAHRDIDLARPKANYNKSAGYMQEEIDGMDRYAEGGFVDTFRHFHPGAGDHYSWWSYRAGAREKNVGWRIDYLLVSRQFIPSVKGAFIMQDIMGSDHCPVGIQL